MFLALTGYAEHWDRDEVILVPGSWCLREDRRSYWEPLQFTRMANRWRQGDSLERGSAECAQTISWLLNRLTAFLNQTHQVNHDERYWNIVLGAWLVRYVHAFYDRYLTIQSCFSQYPDLHTHTLKVASYYTPTDGNDFEDLINGSDADGYNFQIFSQIIHALGLESRISREIEVPIKPASESKLFHWRNRLKAIIFPWLSRFIPHRIIMGSTGLTTRQTFQLVQTLGITDLPLPGPCQTPSVRGPIQASVREALSSIPAYDEFTLCLAQSLPVNLPISFLENYPVMLKLIQTQWLRRTPKIVLSRIDWHLNEPFRVAAAEWQERGALLYVIQHGGGYGITRLSPFEKFEQSFADRWLSYGWREEEAGEKVLPLPQPRFNPSISKTTHLPKRKDILYIATTCHPHPQRLENGHIGHFEEVLSWRMRFIDALPESVRRHLVIKLHPLDWGWGQAALLKTKYGTLSIVEKEKYLPDMLKDARIVVIEYLGTAMLDTLSHNMPTVLFWDPSIWEIRPNAQSYFNDFEKVGILITQPEKAAAHLVSNYNSPDPWWTNPLLQKARRQFVDQHAWGNTHWARDWAKALRESIPQAKIDVVATPDSSPVVASRS
jgi:putative transferase (TIGR04331 family)